MAEIQDYKQEVANTRKGCLGGSDGKMLAQIAADRGCGRLEWRCLNSNKPGIDFYLSLGAEPMSDWTTFRVAEDTLMELAKVP
jgi:hypothetical protein